MEKPGVGQGFHDFYGMNALVENLKKGVNGPAPVHAYLLCGPEGTGKKSLAAICARALNCQGAGEKPCNVCGSCKRYLAGSHPDHIQLVGEKNDKGLTKAIGAEQVRQLIRQLNIQPYEGGRHTVIIEQADKMTVQAQNILLKTLEDPPGSAVIFLVAGSTAGLLPTILSRVRTVRFAPLDEKDCARALAMKGVGEERAALLARAAQGCVGQALQLDTDEEYWQLRKRVAEALSALKGPDTVAGAAAHLKDDKDKAARIFAIMEQMARTAMEMQEKGQAYDGPSMPPPFLVLRGAMDMRRMLESNVNWQYALEMLFFKLAENAG